MKLLEPLKTKLVSIAHQIDNETFNGLDVIEASLSGLKNILSAEEIKDNKNFQYYAGDLAVGSVINRNDDGITIEDAVRVYQKFEGTPIDVEHLTSKVVGYIVKARLTDPETKEVLSDEQALSYGKPINISIAFVIWPRVDKSLSNILEEVGSEESPAAGLISLSWELAFDEYKLLTGSRNVFEGTIIDDDSEIEKIEGSLKCNGGNGIIGENVPVYRLVTGAGLLPLGAGLVVKPAAQVKGVIKLGESNAEENNEETADASLNNEVIINPSDTINDVLLNYIFDRVDKKFELSSKQLVASLEKSSLSNDDTVKQLRMKIKNISDINDESIKTVEASEITRFIASELENKATEHQKAIEAKEQEAANIKAAADEAIAKANEANEKLEALTKELDEIKAARLSEKAEADFNVRMAALDEEFELNDDDRKVVASQIKDLTDETFASWKESFDIIASAKSKEFLKKFAEKKGEEKGEDKKECCKEDEAEGKKECKASEDEDPLKEIVANKSTVPSSIAFGEDALAKFRDAFKIGTSVTFAK